MSDQVPEADLSVERDPDTLGEEHEVEDAPEAQPEEYSPQLDVADPVREASRADVVDQVAEVPIDEDGPDVARADADE